MNFKDIYTDKLLTIRWEDEQNILVFQWSNHCSNLVQEDFEEKSSILRRYVTNKEPKGIIMNLYHCDYFVEPDNYRWYEKTMFSLLDLKKQIKLAIIVPQNLYVHASFEAARISLEKEKLPVQYFIDTEKAVNWILLT